MPSEDIKVLEFNQYQKSDKALFMQILDIEKKSLIDVKIILKIISNKSKWTYTIIHIHLQYLFLQA